MREHTEYMRRWRAKNREKYDSYWKSWYSANIERERARSSAWAKANRSKVNAWKRASYAKKLRTDPVFRIVEALRKRFYRLVSRAQKCESAIKLLGCSRADFRIYIESKFETGMTWENYGTWHLDHIIPCALFDLSKEDHQKRCFHFSNYQPMLAYENMSKGKKITRSHQFQLGLQ